MWKMHEGAEQHVVSTLAAQEGGEKVWRSKQKTEGVRETT